MDTSQNHGLWTMGKGEFEESVKQVEGAIAKRGGNPRQLFDRIRTDASFTDRIAEFMLRSSGLQGSVHHQLARTIMGKNFFGIEEWSAYGVNFSKKQLREVTKFPWNKDILNAPCPFVKDKSIRETHFAFLGLYAIRGKPLTIIMWQELLHPALGQPRFSSYASDSWYENETFANFMTCAFRWYLMPLEIILKPTDKPQSQIEMLPPEYEVPFAIEEATKDLLYYRKNGVYLNSIRYGRCKENVHVGYFDSEGLKFFRWKPFCYCLYNFGLAASRKPPQ